MIDFEKQSGTAARVVDLNELYPDVERMPVSSKLRTYLRQVSLKIAQDKILENNPYLARLVNESFLFLPEMFLDRWVKHWEYQVVIALEGSGISSSIDFTVNRENEVLIVDWSGMQGDRPNARTKRKPNSFFNCSSVLLPDQNSTFDMRSLLEKTKELSRKYNGLLFRQCY